MIMTDLSQDSMIEINIFQEISQFKNEDEEADFWANHCLGDVILDQMESFDDISLIENAVLEKLRQLPKEKQQEVLDFTDFLLQKVTF